MYRCIEVVGDKVYLHLAEISLKATKNFTHGRVTLDRFLGTVTFGSLPPVALPPELVLEDGKQLFMQLVAPDGKPRKQTRTGTLLKVKDADVYRIRGLDKTPSAFPAEDGWTNSVIQYRAYYTHPGLRTTGYIPDWLQGSIARQRSLWNRMAWYCRQARRRCSPVPSEEIKAFIHQTVFPAIDDLNNSLGRSRKKMKYPKKLTAEAPGVDGLWKFVGILHKRIEAWPAR